MYNPLFTIKLHQRQLNLNVFLVNGYRVKIMFIELFTHCKVHSCKCTACYNKHCTNLGRHKETIYQRNWLRLIENCYNASNL